MQRLDLLVTNRPLGLIDTALPAIEMKAILDTGAQQALQNRAPRRRVGSTFEVTQTRRGRVDRSVWPHLFSNFGRVIHTTRTPAKKSKPPGAVSEILVSPPSAFAVQLMFLFLSYSPDTSQNFAAWMASDCRYS